MLRRFGTRDRSDRSRDRAIASRLLPSSVVGEVVSRAFVQAVLVAQLGILLDANDRGQEAAFDAIAPMFWRLLPTKEELQQATTQVLRPAHSSLARQAQERTGQNLQGPASRAILSHSLSTRRVPLVLHDEWPAPSLNRIMSHAARHRSRCVEARDLHGSSRVGEVLKALVRFASRRRGLEPIGCDAGAAKVCAFR